MNVIIQEMIRPEVSGVLFTADPVTNRHDRISLSLLQGVGEDLMSGSENGENLSFYKHFKFLRDLPECKLISRLKLRELAEQALEIEKKYEQPADLEWAIDKDGTIWWLQLRPVTSLIMVHLNELDSKPNEDDPVYTRGNIGEMMPGPVTPLTLSTFGVALEYGLQVFYKKVGAIPGFSKKNIFVRSFYNHLFFDLRGLYNVAKKVKLSSKENVDLAIVGEIVPGIEFRFLEAPVDDALYFLKNIKNPRVKAAWSEFMKRHGHRCVREAELREKEWALDPTSVVEGLKAKTLLLFNGMVKKLSGYAMEPVDFSKD